MRNVGTTSFIMVSILRELCMLTMPMNNSLRFPLHRLYSEGNFVQSICRQICLYIFELDGYI